MNVKLKVERGPTRSRVVPLRVPESVIGRGQGNAVRIPSAEVSRQHCVLRQEDGYVTVEDLNSLNGTYLNGSPVTGRQVAWPGDRLTVGPLTFVVEYEMTQEAIDRLRAADPNDQFEIVEEMAEAESAEDWDLPLPVIGEEDLPDLPVAEEIEELPELEAANELEIVNELEVVDELEVVEEEPVKGPGFPADKDAFSWKVKEGDEIHDVSADPED
jgi:pSer/pThr/pTyr-binding forkhead associated (FHA) protein